MESDCVELKCLRLCYSYKFFIDITVAHSSDGGATSTLINAGNAVFRNSIIKNGKDQFYNPPNMLIYWDGSNLYMM